MPETQKKQLVRYKVPFKKWIWVWIKGAAQVDKLDVNPKWDWKKHAGRWQEETDIAKATNANLLHFLKLFWFDRNFGADKRQVYKELLSVAFEIKGAFVSESETDSEPYFGKHAFVRSEGDYFKVAVIGFCWQKL